VKQTTVNGTRITLVRGDITQQDTVAIVNAANSTLMGGGGVDGAIHRAGGPAILEACRKIIGEIGRCDTGQAVITPGGNLRAKYVIHTVGPVWAGGGRGEPELLARAYRNSLDVARLHAIPTISFPSISTGAYGYPLEPAARVALTTITDFAGKHPFDEIRLVLFFENHLATYENVLSGLI
jgi:O-acetyl-ADP-ribose deacetylase (regulator of RNase III)